MPDPTQQEMEGFSLGTPSIVCRWRLADRCLPLENRHLRALAARRVEGFPVSRALVSWAKQHIEWTLVSGSVDYPNGVLMLIVDQDGKAAMTVGPYEPLAQCGRQSLVARAREARVESDETGVAPETIWSVRDGSLVAGIADGQTPSGTASLVIGLAETLGLPVIRDGSLADGIASGRTSASEVFLVSDEHGVVPASDASGPRSAKLAASYQKLLDQTKRAGR